MTGPEIIQNGRVNLANSQVRFGFLSEIISSASAKARASGKAADYTDVTERLAEQFSEVIGARSGPFRGTEEKMERWQRLYDIGVGFVAGLGREPSSCMPTNWAWAVMRAIRGNYLSAKSDGRTTISASGGTTASDH